MRVYLWSQRGWREVHKPLFVVERRGYASAVCDAQVLGFMRGGSILRRCTQVIVDLQRGKKKYNIHKNQGETLSRGDIVPFSEPALERCSYDGVWAECCRCGKLWILEDLFRECELFLFHGDWTVPVVDGKVMDIMRRWGVQ